VYRLLANGNADNTFGVAGRVKGRISPNYPKGTRFECVKQLSDGKILTCGKVRDSSFVARFNADGSLDTGFGLQGTAYWRLGSLPTGGYTYAKDIQVLTSGKFLVTYLHFMASETSTNPARLKTFYSIAQYNANGSLDTGFGMNGLLTNTKITYGGEKYLHTITNIGVQATGKIVLATHGYNTTTQTDKVYVYRYNANGSIDTGFGSNGVDSAGISFPVKASPCSVLIDPSSDKILVSTTGLNHSVALLRYNTNGGLDPSFATNGKWQAFNEMDFYYDDNDPTTDDYSYYTEELSKMAFHNGQLLLEAFFTPARSYSAGLFRIYPFDTNGNILRVRGIVPGYTQSIIQWDAASVSIGIGFQGSNLLIYGDNNIRTYINRYLPPAVGTLDANAPALPIAVFPNPIDEATQVQYDLLKAENITITMQDMLGRTVATFINKQTQAAGQHTETLTLPQGLAAGTYLITVSTAETSRSIKVVKR
jgi:uncharacterized delta-60 repeat protein